VQIGAPPPSQATAPASGLLWRAALSGAGTATAPEVLVDAPGQLDGEVVVLGE
jgi:hypothetical protein